MKDLILTNEEPVCKTPRMAIAKVSYGDSGGNHVLTHMIVRSKPSVAVIVLKNGKIAFIEQFRSTTGKCYYEIPAGLIEEGETEAYAARREVREETGLLIGDVDVFVKGPSLLDPSKSDENYGVALAKVIGKKRQSLDEFEQISEEIKWIPEQEVFRRLHDQMFKGKPFYNRKFLSGHSLYALLAYESWKRGL